MRPISEPAMNLLQYSLMAGVGPATLRKKITRTNDLESLVSGVSSINIDFTENVEAGASKAQQILEDCVKHHINVVCPFDKEYPKSLLGIEDFPPILFYKGNARILNHFSAAVVGTRDASKLGESWAKQIGSYLAERDWVAVSGLARGIDAAAHVGALEHEARTVAVMAHGLHMVTPKHNTFLAERIFREGGALVSEHPPGVPPRKPEYVRRNRLQSGMSRFSIIVESGESGGAIHQARFTRSQNRGLFVVVPETQLAKAKNFNLEGARYLQSTEGAVPLTSRDDLMNALERYEGLQKLSGNTDSEQFKLI